MHNFRWHNWITDDQRDLEAIAKCSPHEDDRIKALRLLRDSQALRNLQGNLSGEARREAGRRAEDLEDD